MRCRPPPNTDHPPLPLPPNAVQDLNDDLPLPTKPNRPADQFEHPDDSVKPVPTPAGVPPPPGHAGRALSSAPPPGLAQPSSSGGGGDATDSMAQAFEGE